MKNLYPILLIPLLLQLPSAAQESPFFVTYTHHMEEPGNLDLEFSTTNGIPRTVQSAYVAPYLELEYGVTARWTSELYLEYEDLNEASRIQKEIEGGGPDLTSPNALLSPTRDHELEGKLILSSDYHDWNISENFILAKNFSQSEGIEFGYSFGVSRPLALLASARDCHFCRENFSLGAELYGGLGSALDFGLHDTAHYFAPVLSWAVSDNSTLRLSPGIGLTHETNPVLIRFGYTYEIQGFTQRVAKLFGRKP